MDETANQMSDVRERLIETLDGLDCLLPVNQIVDAIMARFDVAEKPVVTAEELGRMMFAAYLGMHSTAEDNGMQLLGQLERAGLTIVRSGEAAK